MSWLNYDPWNPSLRNAPCIAIGRNSINSGGGRGGPGGGPGGTGGRRVNSNPGRIECLACLSPSNANILDVTLTIYPGLDDLNQSYSLFENRIFINGYSVDIISDSSYPFIVNTSQKISFIFQVNAGNRIPNWSSTNNLNISVFLCKTGEHFNRSKIIYTHIFSYNKGPLSPPVSIRIDGNNAILTFKGLPGTSCACYSDCIPSSGLNIICKDSPIEVTEKITTSDDRCMDFDFIFTDSNGNENSFTIPVVKKVKPLRPFLTLKGPKPNRRLIIGVNFLTYTLRDIYECISAYQIERFIGSEKNKEIFSDWKKLTSFKRGTILGDSEGIHTEDRLKTQVKYGYRVRYKGLYGDISEWSDWSTITPTVLSEDNQNDDAIV